MLKNKIEILENGSLKIVDHDGDWIGFHTKGKSKSNDIFCQTHKELIGIDKESAIAIIAHLQKEFSI